MKIHHFHPDTGAHLCSSDAEPDPLEWDLARREAFEAVLKPVLEAYPDPEAPERAEALEKAKVAAEAVAPPRYLVPANATDVAPPKVKAGQQAVFADGAWSVADAAKPAEPEPEIPEDERLWSEIRAERAKRLRDALEILERHRTQADFGLPTVLTADQAKAWAIYAQALRDLPQTQADPKAITWPDRP